jgi:thiol-disulfide isomerase/thioredoxin
MRSALTAAAVSVLACLTASATAQSVDQPSTEKPDRDMTDTAAADAMIDLPAGWRWELEPIDLHPRWERHGHVRFVPSGAISIEMSGETIVTLHIRNKDLDAEGSAKPQYEMYLIDADGSPVQSPAWSMTGNDELQIERRRFTRNDDDPPIVKLGLAVIDLEGRRERAAVASERAEEIGASVLPLPIIGEPFDFDLPTMSGDRIDSAELRGRPILIDCWATWCNPCMAKMPKLRKVHEKYGDDLVIIGIDMDEDLAKAKAAIESEKLIWPQVHAHSAAAGDDDLWEHITGITAIPRMFLIDREGILRLDFYPWDLEEQIGPYLGEDAEH